MSDERPVHLRIPGPTPLPPEVRQAASGQMINHRGPEFRALLAEVTAGLQEVLATRHDVILLTASGTGGLEAAVVNTLSPGDRVLAVSIGYFGERFAAIAQAYGAEVVPLAFPWGAAADPDRVRQALRADPAIRAVLVTHNETSTGVANDLAALAAAVKEEGRLLLVDAISSAACLELRTDAWGLDVVVAGSQKGWLAPPGLAIVAISPAAWEAQARARMPRFYFDLRRAREAAQEGSTPWTPALSVCFALREGLRRLRAEGVEAVWARHRRVGRVTREGLQRLGLRLVPQDERTASDTVTAFWLPDGADAKAVLQRLRTDHGVVLAGGPGQLAGRILRIGHLGAVTEGDITPVLEALRAVLAPHVPAVR